MASALLLSACSRISGVGAPAATVAVAPPAELRPLPPPAAPSTTSSLSPVGTAQIELSAWCIEEPEGSIGLVLRVPDGHGECRYQGEQLFLIIGITNRGTTEIDSPLNMLERPGGGGPNIRLVDNRTGRALNLPIGRFRGPSEVFPPLRPGQTAGLQWSIGDQAFEQLGWRRVNATAEISLSFDVKMGGRAVSVSGKTKLRITGETKPQR